MVSTTADVMERALSMVGWSEPPGDSATYVEGSDIETALVGIDLESAELQLAAREGYDLVLTHHPAGGAARLQFPEVLDRQVDLMTDHGVPTEAAEAAVSDLRENATYGAHSSNYRQEPSVAEHLDQPYMNIHLPPDELGRRAFVETADALPADATVGDLADAFERDFPEIRRARTDVAVRLGDRSNPAGEVAIHHAAGTNGGAEVARAYYEHGVDTVVYIHVGAGAVRDLREDYPEKNLVVTGHIASDAVGMNELADELDAAGLACTRISGLNP